MHRLRVFISSTTGELSILGKRTLASGAPVAIAVHHGESEIRETEVLGRYVEMVARSSPRGSSRDASWVDSRATDTRDP